MMPMVDVSDLKEWVENWFYMNRNYHPYSKSNDIPIQELYDILERMPTVDVVRCRECQNWETDWEPIYFDHENPRYFCGEIDRYPGGDWFCSMGERRKDGDRDD